LMNISSIGKNVCDGQPLTEFLFRQNLNFLTKSKFLDKI